jgi:hypothetical protein
VYKMASAIYNDADDFSMNTNETIDSVVESNRR